MAREKAMLSLFPASASQQMMLWRVLRARGPARDGVMSTDRDILKPAEYPLGDSSVSGHGNGDEGHRRAAEAIGIAVVGAQAEHAGVKVSPRLGHLVRGCPSGQVGADCCFTPAAYPAGVPERAVGLK